MAGHQDFCKVTSSWENASFPERERDHLVGTLQQTFCFDADGDGQPDIRTDVTDRFFWGNSLTQLSEKTWSCRPGFENTPGVWGVFCGMISGSFWKDKSSGSHSGLLLSVKQVRASVASSEATVFLEGSFKGQTRYPLVDLRSDGKNFRLIHRGGIEQFQKTAPNLSLYLTYASRQSEIPSWLLALFVRVESGFALEAENGTDCLNDTEIRMREKEKTETGKSRGHADRVAVEEDYKRRYGASRGLGQQKDCEGTFASGEFRPNAWRFLTGQMRIYVGSDGKEKKRYINPEGRRIIAELRASWEKVRGSQTPFPEHPGIDPLADLLVTAYDIKYRAFFAGLDIKSLQLLDSTEFPQSEEAVLSEDWNKGRLKKSGCQLSVAKGAQGDFERFVQVIVLLRALYHGGQNYVLETSFKKRFQAMRLSEIERPISNNQSYTVDVGRANIVGDDLNDWMGFSLKAWHLYRNSSQGAAPQIRWGKEVYPLVLLEVSLRPRAVHFVTLIVSKI